MICIDQIHIVFPGPFHAALQHQGQEHTGYIQNGFQSIVGEFYLVVSTVGSNWKPEAKMEVHLAGYDNYLKQIGEKKLSSAKLKPSFDDMKTYTVPLFEIYRNGTGFGMLKIAGDNVTIEFYTNASGKPSMVKVLR